MARVWLITGSARGLSRRRVVDSLCIDQPLAGEQDGKLSAVQPHPKGAVSMKNQGWQLAVLA